MGFGFKVSAIRALGRGGGIVYLSSGIEVDVQCSKVVRWRQPGADWSYPGLHQLPERVNADLQKGIALLNSMH